MSEPFLGEIKIISWNFPPKGWAFCNGQLLPINQNQALFAVLGTTYGGDGRQTFGLPNLQGRVPFHVGNGIVLGEIGGETSHTLSISELSSHLHNPVAVNTAADQNTGDIPGNTFVPAQGAAALAGGGSTPVNIYGVGNPTSTFSTAAISATGGNQPHENTSPYLVLNMVIALQGIFPSPN